MSASLAAVGRILSAMMALLIMGCQTIPEFPPIDMSQPGWQVRQGQAVWRPQANAPELSGELLWASHADGRFLLQFLKTPITLIEAQATRDAWRISFPAQGKILSGPRRRSPSQRLGWLHLAAALQRRGVAQGWKFTASNDRRDADQRDRDGRSSVKAWKFSNARTGEMIEGYFAQ